MRTEATVAEALRTFTGQTPRALMPAWKRWLMRKVGL